jgi:flagellar assembly factor FliW
VTAAADGFLVETRFGDFHASRADIVTMVETLAGFDGCRRYVLIAPPEIAPFTCVHGLDEDGPSFLAIDPRFVDPEFPADLTDSDKKRLLDADSDHAAWLWLALVHISADERAAVNLRAPVVVNPARMVGLQVIAEGTRYTTDMPLRMA